MTSTEWNDSDFAQLSVQVRVVGLEPEVCLLFDLQWVFGKQVLGGLESFPIVHNKRLSRKLDF